MCVRNDPDLEPRLYDVYLETEVESGQAETNKRTATTEEELIRHMIVL